MKIGSINPTQREFLKLFALDSSEELAMEKKEVPKQDSVIEERIYNSLKQVKLIQDGKLPRRTVENMLDEL